MKIIRVNCVGTSWRDWRFAIILAIIAILFTELLASAALPPLPVSRPKPLLSPKHASAVKSSPMFRPASITEPPRLPMIPFFRLVQSEYGRFDFSAQALQPANQSILFELSPDLAPGSWVGLAWFGPYPTAQQVFAGIVSDRPLLYIRATVTPAPATMARVVSTVAGEIRLNQEVRGVRAWRGVK